MIATETILIIEDDPTMLRVLKDNFEYSGMLVKTARDGEAGLELALHTQPDLILLDIMLPKINGYEVCRLLRDEGVDIPIIMLTAKGQESDIVLGLNLGADDYVTKPFRPRELVARVRAVLRRSGQTRPKASVLRAADITLDRERHTVEIGEQYVDLTPSEFDLLATMMSVPGRAYSRLELLDRIQGVAYEGYERTIDVHIKNLRSKVEPKPKEPHYIQTVYGVGYRFVRE